MKQYQFNANEAILVCYIGEAVNNLFNWILKPKVWHPAQRKNACEDQKHILKKPLSLKGTLMQI